MTRGRKIVPSKAKIKDMRSGAKGLKASGAAKKGQRLRPQGKRTKAP